jgi:hypothetical protein
MWESMAVIVHSHLQEWFYSNWQTVNITPLSTVSKNQVTFYLSFLIELMSYPGIHYICRTTSCHYWSHPRHLITSTIGAVVSEQRGGLPDSTERPDQYYSMPFWIMYSGRETRQGDCKDVPLSLAITFRLGLHPKWHTIPYIMYYIWSKVVYYKRNKLPFWTQRR